MVHPAFQAVQLDLAVPTCFSHFWRFEDLIDSTNTVSSDAEIQAYVRHHGKAPWLFSHAPLHT